jgi:YVTN family beta-propeller protein
LEARRNPVLNRVIAGALLATLGGPLACAQSFVNWEAAQTHPVELTPDGTRMLVLSTPQGRLLVYSLFTDPPSFVGSIPVGLEPVSVRARTADEAWVVNTISDTVSIVDLNTMNVKQTITVGDEPYDVVFAGTPQRAFVSVAALNQVWVYDAATPASATTVNIAGEDPRALATDGSRVYAAIFESGNKTTVIKTGTVSSAINPYPGDPNPPPNSGTTFNPPLAPGLPTPPAVSLIVKRMPDNTLRDDNNGNWTGAILSNTHDNDVVVIDANTLAIQTPAKGLMNANMAIGLRPLTGGGNEVTVVGTDATNLIRFEPNLKSTFIRVNLGSFNAATPTAPSVADLNPQLTYAVRSVPQAVRDEAVGDPRGIAWDPTGSVGYVTGMGSNNVIAIAPGGARLGRVDVGEGPTGIVYDTARDRLYVLNRFDSSVSVLSAAPLTELSRFSFMDPTPPAVSVGRRFLYDTHLTSGLGQASCASCHIDGRMDQLAWDLGDPSGSPKAFNQVCLGSPGACENWHPMKGPIVTQSLQGITGTEPLHWRGDREGVSAFNGAFMSINGDDTLLTPTELSQFQAYIATLRYPPQPNRNFDNSLPAAVGLGNPITGQNLFNTAPTTGNANLPCIACHTSSSGADFGIIPGADFNGTQSMKIPQLRNMYKKTGFTVLGSNNNRGFGYIHDGTFESISTFLSTTVFRFPSGSVGNQQRQDLQAFLMCWDTGTHAAVGEQSTLASLGSASPSQINTLDAMESLANTNVVGLIARGALNGIPRGWRYNGSGVWQSDQSSVQMTTAAVLATAGAGSELTYTIVVKGTETRLGIDRDDDGFFDQTEVIVGTDPDNAASVPPACPGDMNGDRVVNTADLTAFLGIFGATVTPGVPGDFDGNGSVNTADLTFFLGNFGGSCPLP